jgi:hypothetical protein
MGKASNPIALRTMQENHFKQHAVGVRILQAIEPERR